MTAIIEKPMSMALMLCVFLAWGTTPARSETLFEDEFEFFELGETWQEHGAGAPDVGLDVGFADESEVLQMTSSGSADEFRGIEMISPISLLGLGDLTIDARLRPINQGVEGSIAAAEIALIGQTGEIVRAFASNNAGPDPESANDWADHYEDSKGNIATSGPWPHCDAACDGIRNFVLSVTRDGTTIQAFDDLDDPDFPTWETSFDDFTLSDLGSSFKIALRQLAVDGGDNVTGFFDYVIASTSGGGIRGDFNGDGVLDSADIDDLTAISAAGTNPLSHDLTGDSLVDMLDVNVWVKDLFQSWIGDANLDKEFSSSDLVTVLGSGTYEADLPAVWSTGDFNGDGQADSGDLVAALSDGGYELGPPAAVAAVPEPTSCLPLIFAGVSIIGMKRRSRRHS